MHRLIRPLVLTLVGFACVSQNLGQQRANLTGGQGVILSDVPRRVDPKARYLLYLHGYIVEAGNTRPVSPKFGVYEYEQILETFRRGGFVVISEARKKDPEIEPYAAKVAGQVRRLLEAGVPPQHITVVGASQGSWIAMLASTYLENRNINFVIIASCAADEGFLNLVNLHGKVLSIYEKTDLSQSCSKYRADATGIGEWKEVEVNTGLKHGFLYRPLKEWTEPTIAWAKR
ncbi:MAG TPA: hypothetical protein VM864_00785 [Pyrinomonadaceae bacterium]|jgi:pimeloyl-ACP methyl ester carboxylesterase|nr:hypothetical protein [Pyrinomonadaceae bacterium]